MDPQQHAQLTTIIRTLAYTHQSDVAQDVASLFAAYPNALRVTSGRYETDGVKSRPLLCLEGVLPVTYKGSSYYIPIKYYVAEEHPHKRPMAIVVPTAEMLVKPGAHVSADGVIQHPALSTWDPKRSTLVSVAHALRDAFAAEPPVYAKPQRPSKPALPPLPPKPIQHAAMLRHADTAPAQQSPPPVPPKTIGEARSSSSPLKAPVQSSPVAPYSPLHYSLPARYIPGHQPNGSHSEPLIPMDDDEAMLVELRNAVTQKVRVCVGHVAGQMTREKQHLRDENVQLRRAQHHLDTALMAVRENKAKAEANIEAQRGHIERLQQSREALDKKPLPGPDDLVVTPWPLYEQLLRLVAEDNAVADTLFHLGRALDRGAVSLDMYLKSVRVLSRQQFTARALIIKAREAAGLPPI